MSVHGYREEGDITTPFDMRVVNELDRFHLAQDAVSQVGEKLESDKVKSFNQKLNEMLKKHHDYIREVGADLPEIQNWVFQPLN